MDGFAIRMSDSRRRGLSRRVALQAGVAAIGVLAAACGGAETPSAAKAPSQPVTLTYLTLANAQRQEGEQALFAELAKAQPNVKVEITPVGPGWPDVKTKWQVLHSGGTPPHFVHNGWGEWNDLRQGGTLAELTPLFKRDKLTPDKVYFPTTIEHWSDGGQMWGIPVSVSVDVLGVNLQLLEQVGLPVPPANPADRSWTVEKFLDVAQKLTRGEEQYGFLGKPAGYRLDALGAGTWFGELPWDEQKKQARLNTPGFVRALQFFKDLRDRYRVAPPLSLTGDHFRTGKAAMQVHPTFRPALPFKWAAVALPYSGTGRSISGRQFPNGFQIDKWKDVDASWTIFRGLMEPAINARLVAINGHVVSPLQQAEASAASMRAFETEFGVKAETYFLQQQCCKTTGWGLFKYPEYGQIVPEIETRWNDVLNGKVSVQAFADDVTQIVDQRVGPAARATRAGS
jgi:ABC-type glycerol-3-phosphate transport system substrate-binding protein